MTRKKSEEIKEDVREHYSQVARSVSESSGCCASSTTCCCEGSMTSAEELESIPEEAVRSSRGCGNPVALAGLRPGEVVLDLGSGGGLDVMLAARRVGAEGFVYGLDMTEEMLELARRNAQRAGLNNVTFLKGDIEKIPLLDASADVIISNCVINLTPDKGQALREAFRVLKPGGRLAVSDIVIDGDLQGLPVNEEQIRAALSWVGCIAGALTKKQYEELLSEAGFGDIDIKIQHRYSPDDLLPQAAKSLANLVPQVIRDLVSRFTSSTITAKKPIAE